MFSEAINELFKRVRVHGDTEKGAIKCPNCGLPITCIRKFIEAKPKEGLTHD